MAFVISAAQLLADPTAEPIIEGSVLVEADTVVAVGHREDVLTLAGDAPELRFPGATILPGLINAHVHLAFDGGPSPIESLQRETDDARLVLAMAGRARELLDCGVTTARDLGDRGALAVRVRDAITAGVLLGPRILAATAPLTPPGGHCWFLGGEVRGDDDIREQVGRNADAGADLIKVMVSGGQVTPGGAGMSDSQFTTAELRVAVTEAHRRGLRVAAHAHGTESIRSSVEAGVDTIEHCTWLAGPGDFRPDEQIAAQIADRGIVVCHGSSNHWRPLAAKIGAERARAMVGRVRWLADHGVRLIAGTDAGLCAFTDFPAALGRYTEWDFTPAQILRMTTVDAAAALGLADQTGRLAVGLSADLVVVAGDPTTDLAALHDVELVVARGRCHLPPAAAAARLRESPTTTRL